MALASYTADLGSILSTLGGPLSPVKTDSWAQSQEYAQSTASVVKKKKNQTLAQSSHPIQLGC